MRKGLLQSALAAAVLCASLAYAGEPRVGKFTRYDTGEYTIVTSRGAVQAQRFMEDLVKFRVTLERMLGKRAAANAFPTTILISSESDWNKWLQPRQNVAGFFQRSRFSNYMALNGEASLDEALHVMFHEYTHYYLATQFAGEYPPWFNEGLAEVMGYAKFDKGMAILRIPMDQVHQARTGDWIPFDRLIRVDQSDPEYQSHDLAPSFYAQSWLTVQYGVIEDREFGKKIFQYLNQLNRLVPPEQATSKSFGSDLSVIDKQLRDYLKSEDRHSGAINLGEVPPVQLAEGTRLDDLDSLATLADLMLESRLAPDRIRPLIESLERRDQNVARAAILAARLAQYADDNDAFGRAVARAEGALAPGDWEQRRELAAVLLVNGLEMNPLSNRSSEDANKDVERALKWFAEAISHNDADVEALWGFGTAATRLDRDLDAAEKALVTAYKRAPASAEIAMSLANLKARQQKPEEMLPLLKDVIRLATNLGARRWAAETYLQTEDYIAERNKVDAENKKHREDYERQVAEYEKKYGKAKKKK